MNNKTKKKTQTKNKNVVSKTNKEKVNLPALLQDENSYARTILAAVIICIIFLSGYFFLRNTDDNTDTKESAKITEDEKRFKKEYESINGTTRSNGDVVKKIEVKEDNNIVYVSLNEVNKIIEEGSGIIYFGYAADDNCRSIVPILIDAINEEKIDKVYYVNVRTDDKLENDIRDLYELNEKNKAKHVKDGLPGYRELITLLADRLDDYVLVSDKGKKISTGEKRLNVPTVVAVKDGYIVGYSSINESEKVNENKIKNSYKELIKSYKE